MEFLSLKEGCTDSSESICQNATLLEITSRAQVLYTEILTKVSDQGRQSLFGLLQRRTIEEETIATQPGMQPVI